MEKILLLRPWVLGDDYLHARVILETWRKEYNEQRPKSSLSSLTPVSCRKTQLQQTIKLTTAYTAQRY
ncbi:integrase core domain-containing protein [Rhodoferax potami]|uniref:integrase core domain-containing protein n=1 Tax=Rhodoferax potami TaxID=3068338 RepID=UPI003D341AE5